MSFSEKRYANHRLLLERSKQAQYYKVWNELENKKDRQFTKNKKQPASNQNLLHKKYVYRIIYVNTTYCLLSSLASISGGPGVGTPSGLTLKGAKYIWPPRLFGQ